MLTDYQIPEPFIFNPLKHHLGFIKEFTNYMIESESNYDIDGLLKKLKHIGTSVMDVYSGRSSIKDICKEIEYYLEINKILKKELFSLWAGEKKSDFRIISINDGSQWTLKYYSNKIRFVHLFPARTGIEGSRDFLNFRVKSNTLKTAILYNIMIGKDYISNDDINKVRPLLGLSPIKNTLDTETISEMIEILRDSR